MKKHTSQQSVEFLVVFLAGCLLGGVFAASLLLSKSDGLKDSIVAVQAALVPVIALLASYIAYRQARNSELKRKQDLYQMRMETYHALRDFIISIQQKDTLDFAELSMFMKKTTESYFLFNEDIDTYLDQVRRKALEFWRLGKQREKAMEKDDPRAKEISDIEVDASIWIAKQLEEAKFKFSPFLKLE